MMREVDTVIDRCIEQASWFHIIIAVHPHPPSDESSREIEKTSIHSTVQDIRPLLSHLYQVSSCKKPEATAARHVQDL